MRALTSAHATGHCSAMSSNLRVVCAQQCASAKPGPSCQHLIHRDAVDDDDAAIAAEHLAAFVRGFARQDAIVRDRSSSNANKILETGLFEKSYATPNGTLSPLQARLELALNPQKALPDTILRIDLEAMAKNGYSIPTAARVRGANNMPGGGVEYFFPYPIPPTYIRPFWP